MRFTLTYRGSLPGKLKDSVDAKHRVRTQIDPQLQALWGHEPLKSHQRYLDPTRQPSANESDGSWISLLHERRGAWFAATIDERIHAYAALHIDFFRTEPPGRVIGGGGDIDNRIKNLLDGLTVPEQLEQVPRDFNASPESPIYCLLGSDKLVTDLSVSTRQLLAPIAGSDPNDVLLIIHVSTAIWLPTLANAPWA